ncbi:hypothetical protein T492DRAFT_848725 [Pavlovales sp. CCMP2436]|nr:hypothetical protein T492DRAFT_848725 [Pavlovales sp. CCMP2436]
MNSHQLLALMNAPSVPLSYFGSVHSTPAPTKRIKVLSSGRRGFEPYRAPVVQKTEPAAAPPALPPALPAAALDALRAELLTFCTQRGLESAAQICEDCDADELCGLQVGASTDSLGMPREQAARLVSKINGLYARPRRQRVAGGGGERVTGAAPGANRLRLSTPMQARYARAGDWSSEKEKVTTSIQRQVVREAGFSGRTGTREGLELLRSAVSSFPEDAELVDAAFYLRNNIHVRCPLSLGSALRADQLQLPLHLASSGGFQALSLDQLLARADQTPAPRTLAERCHSGELLFDAAAAVDADGAFEGGGEARKLLAFVRGVLRGNKSARSVLPGA